MKQRLWDLHAKVKSCWRKILLFSVGGLLILIVIGQSLYPLNRLLPFTVVDGVNLNAWKKDDAIKQLNKAYTLKTIPIYFGQVKKVYRSPLPAEIGLMVNNKARIDKINYPWYLRIIPSSILWAHFIVQTNTQPTYQRNNDTLASYIDKQFGPSCNINPEDASLKVNGVNFDVIPSQNGGICDVKVVNQILSVVKPQLNKNNSVTLPTQETPPTISNEAARQYGDHLLEKISKGVTIFANDKSQTIPESQITSWIDFSNSDGQLTYILSADRASAYLNQEFAAKVAISPGTTVVSTYNFTEIGRVSGEDGKKLDVTATLNNLKSFIDGDFEQAIVATMPVAPEITYSRSYSSTDTGLTALIQQYAQAHTGVFGVSMVELSGQNRRAAYNDTQLFTSASTYKLFVAYSTLKRVESGLWNWNDQIVNNKNLSVCFDDMIVESDNDCGAALLAKVGYTNITNEAHDIGCVNTSFLGNDGIKTTAGDLALLLAQLQTSQILSQQSSRDRFIDAMKQNVYRQGIPAGVDSVVADKVGFIDKLLHDAAIIYSPTGNYVLVIMTDGSSWSTIADLTGKIEALRVQ